MHRNQSPTAILFFARPELDEVSAREFPASGHRESREVCGLLNRHMLAVLRNTGLPVVRSSELDVEGSDFGSRFVAAIQAVFRMGYSRVISVGNDSPDLDSDLIGKAALELESHDAVIGPALDGGAYLIGIRRDSFDPESWLKLPWQTSALKNSLAGLFNDNRCLVFDEVIIDLDTAGDWQTWFGSTSLRGLARLIVRLFFRVTINNLPSITFEIREPEYGSTDRAPPVRAA